MKDVAQHAGVSIATVSRVLNGEPSVREDLRVRVQRSVKALGYESHAWAKSLAEGRTRLAGVIIPDVGDEFFGRVARAATDRLAQAGYGALIYNTDWRPEKQAQCLTDARRRRLEGLLVLPNDAAEIADHPQWRDEAVVLLDRSHPNLPSVFTDHRAGMMLLVSHLAELGHLEIGYVGFLGDDKTDGFLAAMRTRGLPVRQEALVDLHRTERDRRGHFAVEQLDALQPKVTAVVCTSDNCALDVMRQWIERGLEIPRDIAVTGYNNGLVAGAASPGITTVAQLFHEIGRAAAELLVGILAGGGAADSVPHFALEPRLIVRGSTVSAQVRQGGRASGISQNQVDHGFSKD